MDFNHSYSILERGIPETLQGLLLHMLVYLSGYCRNYSSPFQEHWGYGCANFSLSSFLLKCTFKNPSYLPSLSAWGFNILPSVHFLALTLTHCILGKFVVMVCLS